MSIKRSSHISYLVSCVLGFSGVRVTALGRRKVTRGEPGPPPGLSSEDLLAGGVRLDILVQLPP